jgi:hypothetical protein
MLKIQGQPDLSMAVAPQAKLDQLVRCSVALPFIVALALRFSKTDPHGLSALRRGMPLFAPIDARRRRWSAPPAISP